MKKILLILLLVFIASGCGPKQESAKSEVNIFFGDSEFATDEFPADQDSTKETMRTTIPIITYGHIQPENKNGSSIGSFSTPAILFEKELKWLKNNGYESLSTNDLEEKEVSEKSVIIMFDDGYEDLYTTALPMLLELDFSAGVAIITDKIGQSGYMNVEQLNSLAAQGFEIMSHSKSHPDLTEISPEQQSQEIFESKKYLEDNFDIVVNAFIYPRGEYNDKTVGMMRKAGYGVALTTDPGITDLKASPFRMKRVIIENSDTLEDFIKKVTSEN